jgi:hypothetical protein
MPTALRRDMDRIVEIGYRNPPRKAVGDWFVRVKDGSRPAEYVEFERREEATTYAERITAFANFDMADE